MDEIAVLQTDPFADEFGSPGDRTLRDKMATARKAGECQDCAQQIKPGERIRSMTSLFEGSIHTYRWCALCCEAMAKSWDDAGEAWSDRISLRRSQSDAATNQSKGEST